MKNDFVILSFCYTLEHLSAWLWLYFPFWHGWQNVGINVSASLSQSALLPPRQEFQRCCAPFWCRPPTGAIGETIFGCIICFINIKILWLLHNLRVHMFECNVWLFHKARHAWGKLYKCFRYTKFRIANPVQSFAILLKKPHWIYVSLL